jgi:hypothetical protein
MERSARRAQTQGVSASANSSVLGGSDAWQGIRTLPASGLVVFTVHALRAFSSTASEICSEVEPQPGNAWVVRFDVFPDLFSRLFI